MWLGKFLLIFLINFNLIHVFAKNLPLLNMTLTANGSPVKYLECNVSLKTWRNDFKFRWVKETWPLSNKGVFSFDNRVVNGHIVSTLSYETTYLPGGHYQCKVDDSTLYLNLAYYQNGPCKDNYDCNTTMRCTERKCVCVLDLLNCVKVMSMPSLKSKLNSNEKLAITLSVNIIFGVCGLSVLAFLKRRYAKRLARNREPEVFNISGSLPETANVEKPPSYQEVITRDQALSALPPAYCDLRLDNQSSQHVNVPSTRPVAFTNISLQSDTET